MLNKYLNNIQDLIDQGDAREESFYIHLDSLIRNFAVESKINNIEITILPKKTEAGNPDFRIWDGGNHITGYIEAKSPSVTNLDRVEESGQLKRYRDTFPNAILTNFYEFRLYRNGELIKKGPIGRPVIATKLKTAPPVCDEKGFYELLNTFFSFSLPQVHTAKALAMELAKRTRFLRDEVISIEIAEEERNGKKTILGFYEAFKKYLIGTLTEKSFADLYSQTITYGLFAARTRSDNSFNRELAFKYIPNTIGILRDIFRFISLEDPPKPLQIIVDDIAEVLKVSNVKKILQDYYREGKGKDPIIHFYETFLASYDPAIREKRGVYYTPEPVVGYIVRSIHQILKSHFDIADGLAGENVTLLDPAAGTLTFPAEAIKLAINEYTEKYGIGGKSTLIKNHILKNFYAFELMMAPYAIGHLKMSFLFEELGYRLEDEERFKLYLTNTLEMEDLEQIQIPGLNSLSEESHLAGEVKKVQSVLVIMGNPPYSGHSANQNSWTESLLKENVDGAKGYYQVDGKALGEKKPKWLQDDYVKFLRFAQWKIHKTGYGIVGMITNHSYLENPTFRGMRQSLMDTFNEIYILDLHGSSLKKETAPDGSKDENVFDIRQGTVIVVFIKQNDKKGCKVFHNSKYGLRNEKYDWLSSSAFLPENYEKIYPESPYCFFVKRNTEKIKDYLKWKPVTGLFPVHSAGVVTSSDDFVVDFEKLKIKSRVQQLKNNGQSDEVLTHAFNLKDKKNWNLADARKKIRKLDDIDQFIEPVLYRPFDNRYVFYHDSLIERSRKEVMRHFGGPEKNLGLALSKRVEGNKFWEHAFITDKIITHHSVSIKEVNFLFPLYLTQKDTSKKSHFQTLILFEPEVDYGSKSRKHNIEKSFYEKLNTVYKKNISPEEILHYIYAVLFSNKYRNKYAEYLKIDFPRIPFTSKNSIFRKMAQLGNQLIDLHLMESKLLNTPVSKYHGRSENNRISRVIYDEKEQRVFINTEKYFDAETPEIWNYHIGGYQVLQKYLKDRKGKEMEDPRCFCRIISAISTTIQIQNKIDKNYLDVEKKLIEF